MVLSKMVTARTDGLNVGSGAFRNSFFLFLAHFN